MVVVIVTKRRKSDGVWLNVNHGLPLQQHTAMFRIVEFLFVALVVTCSSNHHNRNRLTTTSQYNSNINNAITSNYHYLYYSLGFGVSAFSSSALLVPTTTINPKRRFNSKSCYNPPTKTATKRSSSQSHSTYSSPSSSSCSMTLIPLDVATMERIISVNGKPTGAQYATYYGRTMKERYSRTIESATVGFLGVFFSYFLSFIIGSFLATILGSLFFFWGILSPELKAYQRNWEFLGGRSLIDIETMKERDVNPNNALYGALYIGHIRRVCVVEDATDTVDDEYDIMEFIDYTMENDEMDKYYGTPYLLRVQCIDQENRILQVHTRLSEDYVKSVRQGMPCSILLLSTHPSFTKLAALSDVFVLTSSSNNSSSSNEDVLSSCWIGDYPYINHIEFEALVVEDDTIWDALMNEEAYFIETNENMKRRMNEDDDDDSSYDENDNDWSGGGRSRRRKVLIPAAITKNRRR